MLKTKIQYELSGGFGQKSWFSIPIPRCARDDGNTMGNCTNRSALEKNPVYRTGSLAAPGMTVARCNIVLTGVLRRKILLAGQDPSLRPG